MKMKIIIAVVVLVVIALLVIVIVASTGGFKAKDGSGDSSTVAPTGSTTAK